MEVFIVPQVRWQNRFELVVTGAIEGKKNPEFIVEFYPNLSRIFHPSPEINRNLENDARPPLSVLHQKSCPAIKPNAGAILSPYLVAEPTDHLPYCIPPLSKIYLL